MMLIDVLDRIHIAIELAAVGIWASVVIDAAIFVHNVYTRRSRG